MPTFFWIPLIVFVICLPAFLLAELGTTRKSIVLPLKVLCSLCFLSLAGLGMAVGPSVTGYDRWMFAGMAFSMLGDIALVWKEERKAFLVGLAAFLVAQILYSIAFSLQNGFSPWDALVFLLLVGAPIAAYRFIDMDVGKMKIPVVAYVAVIALMLTKALSSLYLHGMPSPAMEYAIVGAVLFYLSDVFLALFKFHRRPHKALRAANLTTYFIGQMLLAFSLSLF